MSKISQMGMKSNSGVLYILVGATLITAMLYFIPFLSPLSYPFLLLSTLVHEMSHGVAAIMVGGYFNSFKLWADGSGVASISGDFGRFSRAFVAMGGLLGPAVISAVFFICSRSHRRSRMALGVSAIILTLSLLLVVRNVFGIAFVFFIGGLCYYFCLGKARRYAQIFLCFLAVQLCLSVFSRSDYLFTKDAVTAQGVMPSDVSQIADALFLPYWFWGIICAGVSLGVLVLGLSSLVKHKYK